MINTNRGCHSHMYTYLPPAQVATVFDDAQQIFGR